MMFFFDWFIDGSSSKPPSLHSFDVASTKTTCVSLLAQVFWSASFFLKMTVSSGSPK